MLGKSKASAKIGVILATLAGLLGAAFVVSEVGFGSVLGAALSVGWSGFGILCLYGAANFVLLGLAWLLVMPPYSWGAAMTFCWARAVRDSAGDALPFSQLGGLVIGARATILRGLASATAFASVIVDATVELVAQIGFVLLGLVILALRVPDAAPGLPLVRGTLVALLLGVAAAGGFLLAQRHGFGLLERIAERLLPAAARHVAAVDQAIKDIHAAPGRMAVSLGIHFLGWLSSAFATWLALMLMGAPIAFTSAITIESLLCAARTAVVFLPGAIGVQEAGYAALMPLYGLPPEIGVALSLLKRARELALALPVILSWQLAEARRARKSAA